MQPQSTDNSSQTSQN